MARDRTYIPAFSLDNVFRDKDTGEPLANGTLEFFIVNTSTQKNIYKLTATSPEYTYVPVTNPITLSLAGTIVDGSGNPFIPYFRPFADDSNDAEYYTVVCKSAGGVEQWTREGVPYIPDLLSPTSGASNYTNEISNPQFVEVLFDTESADHTYSFSGASLEAVPLAPDWDLIVTGTGDVTVSRVAPAGSTNVPTNPPYLLKIVSSGAITVMQLRQRFYGSPNLWAGGTISGFMLGKTNTSATSLTMRYVNSQGTSQDIASGTLPVSGAFVSIPGTVTLTASASPDVAPDAYIDIIIDLPTSIEIELTSIQVVFTGDAVINVPYDQTTQNRQIDHLFNYYKSRLEYKPIPSILTGWDFPLNPAQFGVSGSIGTSGGYIWDQTIAARGSTGNVTYARHSQTGGLQFTTAGGNDAFYILQYLSGNQAKKILGTKLSCNLNAYKGTVGDAVTARIYLFRGSSAATIPTLGATIGFLNANGTFTRTAANWTEIPRAKNGVASATLKVVTNDNDINSGCDYGFSGWEITDNTEISNTDKFAIVITFAYVNASTVITVDSASCVLGDIPTRPAPQTPDEVLRECQYYYETTYLAGATIPSAVTGGRLIAPMNGSVSGGTSSAIVQNSWGGRWVVKKRATPSVVFYSGTSTTANNLQVSGIGTSTLATAERALSTYFETPTITNKNYYVQSKIIANMLTVPDTSTTVPPAGWLNYHYVADARLGV